MKLISSSFLGLCFAAILMSQAKAQITTDGTTNTNLTRTDSGVRIDDGSRAGDNLFHSFGEFSVPTGSEAFFNNASDVVNIFSRVTGGNISNIDGLIRANGGANLFLINPAGILFGNNASLQIGGSFYGSTADSIIFSDGVEFAASNPVQPILKINAPIGLRFRDNPGDIVNNSVANGVGLTVAPGENLALIGGNITLEGGIISASEGKIQLGSVADNNVVNLEPVNSSFELGYGEATNFNNITLNEGARITTSEASINLRGDEISLNNGSQIGSLVNGFQVGGDINIQARQLFINNRAKIFTAIVGEGEAGKINLDVSDSIQIVGTGFEEFQQLFILSNFDFNNLLDLNTLLNRGTGIVSAVNGRGAAGNVAIDASQLQLFQGGVIGSFNFGEGASANLTINTTDSIEIASSGLIQSPVIGSTQDTSLLEINTKNFTLSDSGLISTGTLGEGNGGDIVINASEQINLLRSLPNSVFPTVISSSSGGGNGTAGDITINTQRLNLEDGGQITSTSGIVTNQGIIPLGGVGGDININASESIEISGDSPDNILRASGIYSSTFSPNPAGDINIVTDSLSVTNGGQINTSTVGQGTAGDIDINTTKLELKNGVLLSSTGASGDGGTININATEIVEVVGVDNEFLPGGIFTASGVIPLFDSSTQNITGNAGEINITTSNLRITERGEISVRSTARGNGGTLNIWTDSLTLDNGSIAADTSFGVGANVNLVIRNNLTLDNNSLISARAFNNANGGNIDIDAEFVIAFPRKGNGNDIIANAEQGMGGNINITAEALLGIEERPVVEGNSTNDIDASSEFGLDGNVIFNVPDTNNFEETSELSSNVISAETVAKDACSANSQTTTFIVTGKGGVPPTPDSPLSADVLLGDGKPITPNISQSHHQQTTHNISPQVQPIKTSIGDIYPARGVIKTEDGKVILTAYSTGNNATRTPSNITSCNSSNRDQ